MGAICASGPLGPGPVAWAVTPGAPALPASASVADAEAEADAGLANAGRGRRRAIECMLTTRVVSTVELDTPAADGAPSLHSTARSGGEAKTVV